MMDFLSHSEHGGRTRRTPLFHSPLGVVVATVVYATLVFLVLRDLSLLPAILVCGAVSGVSHVLLDLPTERGIFFMGRRTSRRRLLRYDHPAANMLFTFLGLLLLLVSLF